MNHGYLKWIIIKAITHINKWLYKTSPTYNLFVDLHCQGSFDKLIAGNALYFFLLLCVTLWDQNFSVPSGNHAEKKFVKKELMDDEEEFIEEAVTTIEWLSKSWIGNFISPT